LGAKLLKKTEKQKAKSKTAK